MKDDKKVPQLRFPEFTDAWKQRELNEIADTIDTGKSIFSKSNIGKFKILGSTGVIGFDEDYDYEGSFLLTARVGANAGNLYRSSGKVKITDNTVFIKSKFIDYLFYSLEKFNLKRLSFGTGQPLIKSSELKKLNISVPCDENEITKIEHFFITIDRTITLQQRKLNSLQKLKKGLLQKMFPKKGENIPEIRFPKFSDAWKQRELCSLTKRIQGNDGRMDLDILTISAGNGWMKQEERFSGNIAGKEQKNYTLLHKGELSYNHGNSKLAKYGAVFSLQNFEEALVPRVYHSFKMLSGSAKFIEYYFATKLPDRELGKLISSGARMDGLLNIKYDDFMGIKLTIPSEMEQHKISTFFSKLDNTITLQQRWLFYTHKQS